MRLVPIAGRARERGRAHGETLRPLVRAHVERWLDWLGRSHGPTTRDYIHTLATQTSFQSAIERWTPDLLEEVRGIAEGAAVDEELIYGLQLPDEEWWFGRERRLAAGKTPGEAGLACSSLGAPTADGAGSVIGQNMDMPDYLDGLQVVLHVQPADGGPEALVFTVAGLIALNGLNNAGVSTCCNALIDLAHSPAGLPVAYVHRGLLAQPSLEAAEDLVRGVRHASGQNYVLGGLGRVADYECSANAVVPVPPANGRVCHTNHPLTSTDQWLSAPEVEALPANVRLGLISSNEDSTARFRSVEARLQAAGAPVVVEQAQAIFSGHDFGVVSGLPSPGRRRRWLDDDWQHDYGPGRDTGAGDCTGPALLPPVSTVYFLRWRGRSRPRISQPEVPHGYCYDQPCHRGDAQGLSAADRSRNRGQA